MILLWSPQPSFTYSSPSFVTSRCYKQQLSGLYPLGVNELLLPVLLILELYLLNIFDCPHIFFLNLWQTEMCCSDPLMASCKEGPADSLQALSDFPHLSTTLVSRWHQAKTRRGSEWYKGPALSTQHVSGRHSFLWSSPWADTNCVSCVSQDGSVSWQLLHLLYLSLELLFSR